MQSERAAGHGMTEPQARGRAAGDTRASRFAQERPPTALSWCSAGWHPRSYSAAIKYWLQLCYPHAVLRRDSIHAERAARCATASATIEEAPSRVAPVAGTALYAHAWRGGRRLFRLCLAPVSSAHMTAHESAELPFRLPCHRGLFPRHPRYAGRGKHGALGAVRLPPLSARGCLSPPPLAPQVPTQLARAGRPCVHAGPLHPRALLLASGIERVQSHLPALACTPHHHPRTLGSLARPSTSRHAHFFLRHRRCLLPTPLLDTLPVYATRAASATRGRAIAHGHTQRPWPNAPPLRGRAAQ